jgi:type I restriction-modification system DNA methylase subunit
MDNKTTENESLKELDGFFGNIRDMLRNNENITGVKALDVITDFLFLRLLNYEMDKNKKIDFDTYKYNTKIKILNFEYELDDYKKYFKWSEIIKLINIIDKNSTDYETKELFTNVMQYFIFEGVFKFNPKTAPIYKNRNFTVKKMTTLIKLVKIFNKMDFEKYDVDVKGKAYELTIQKEGSVNKDFSQFFTPRWIDKYMVDNADITINKDGSFTKIMDPACGTAGILSEYITKVKQNANKQNITLTNNIADYIYGSEVVEDTLKIAQMNILLKTGTYNENIKNDDFLECVCIDDYTTNKFDGNIIMNPPFSIEKDYDFLKKNLITEYEKFKNIYKVLTKSGTMLFLMSALYSIKKGRQIIMISPNGKEIFSKNKENVNIRKYVVENSNIYKIALLPDGSFKPYTGVQTLVLMTKKGEKTKEIQFVNVSKNKDDTYTETNICKVKYNDLVKKDYSWNYKEYQEIQNKYTNIEYKKLGEICDFLPKSKKNASYGKDTGKYPFFTSSSELKKFCDDYDYKDECIIFGTGGNANIKLSKKFSCSADNFIATSKYNLKYLYYYFLSNMEILEKNFIGTTIKHLSKNNLENLQIPFPSEEIQKIITNDLFLMYETKEALQKSVKNTSVFRKAEFEILLNNIVKNNVSTIEYKKLGEICTFLPKSKKNASYGKEMGKYPFFTSSSELKKYSDDYDYEDECLIFGTGGNANIKISKQFSCSSDNLIVTSKHNLKYLYYYFLTNMEILENLFVGTTIKHISKNDLTNIVLTLPTLEDQKNIVLQIEKYDKLVELQKEQINNNDKIIKNRFDYYINKFIKTQDNNKTETEKTDLEKENNNKKEKIIIEDNNDETFLVGGFECIHKDGNYYKLNGELYAITKNNKVVRYKKNILK